MAPGVAAGCVNPGTYNTPAGGFSAADYTMTGTQVSGGQVTLSPVSAISTKAEHITSAFDQDIFMAFVYEDPADYYYWVWTQDPVTLIWSRTEIKSTNYRNSMAWFIQPLAETRLAANGTPVTGPVSFENMWKAHANYKLSTGGVWDAPGKMIVGGQNMLNYVFPYLRDANNDGVWGTMYDGRKVSYTPNPGGGWPGFPGNMITFGGSISAPSGEPDYYANGYWPDGNGTLDVRDGRVYLGRFKAGTQLAFLVHTGAYDKYTAYTPAYHVNDVNWTYIYFNSPAYGYTWNTGQYEFLNFFYPKWDEGPSSPWCPSTRYATNLGKDSLMWRWPDNYKTDITPGFNGYGLNLKFDLNWPAPQSVASGGVYINGPACAYVSIQDQTPPFGWTQGLFPTEAKDRLNNKFGLTFSGVLDAGNFYYTWGNVSPWADKSDWNPFLFLKPDNDPFTTVLTYENHGAMGWGADDADFNDDIVLIETHNGGTVIMNTAASPTATLTADQFVTSATLKVTDNMPSCPVAGDTRIEYYVSADGGTEWTRVSEWDVARIGNKTGTKIPGWTPGAGSATTYREATISFIGNGIIGNRLVWKAELMTANNSCSPTINDVKIAYTASGPRGFTHTSPVILSNVIYDASYNWGGSGWVDKQFRGHVYSKQLYDPTNWGAWFVLNNWDAGDKAGGSASVTNSNPLLPSSDPKNRKMFTTNNTFASVVDEQVTLTSGSPDGVTRTFSGKVSKKPMVDGSIMIRGADSGGRWEIFRDSGERRLTGTYLGYGQINRDAGTFTITFTKAPGSGTKIYATYTYYTSTSTTPVVFNSAFAGDKMGLDSRGYWDNDGYHYDYDFNKDNAYNASDANWLALNIMGYRDPATKKEWLINAIDHSSPALVGSPGMQGWYFGSDITDNDRITFDEFRCNQRMRKTQLYVGSRSGMVHSFYAGEFRPYYVDENKLVAPFTCSFVSNNANLIKFRGDYNDPGDTGALNTLMETTNPNDPYPYYEVPGNKKVRISRGYYSWAPSGVVDKAVTDRTAPQYGDGSETWSFIPSNLMTRQKNRPLKWDDKAFIDASPAAAHVRFADGTWHTLIIVAQGNGGDQVTAMDVTDVNNPKVLWEFSDPDLYRSRSAPSVGSVGRVAAAGNSMWVVMFVTGMVADVNSYPYVYMLEVETGKLLEQMALSTDAEAKGSIPSGQPALIDSDGNGFADRFYIGTDKGILFKGIMPDNPTASTGVNFGVCTFFKTDMGTVTNERLAIYASPSVTAANTMDTAGIIQYKVNVFFGTSSNPYQNDDPGDLYYFYAVRDTDDKTKCSYGTSLWKFALPAGQRVYASSFATAGRVYFGTSTATSEDPCAAPSAQAMGTTGAIYVFNAEPDAGGNASKVGEYASENVSSTITVDDEKVYFRTTDGMVTARGGNTFQNATKQGGFSEAVIKSWAEILR